MDEANDEETREVFQFIRDHTSDEQWAEISRIMREMYADGVQKITLDDILAIIEQIVVCEEDGEIERLTSEG